MRAKLPIATLLLAILFLAAPTVALFGPPSYVFKGRVNYIQPSNFTLLTDDAKMVRIMVAMDRKIPTELQLGVKVEVKAVQGTDGLWYLDKFEKIELYPTP